MKFYEEFLAIWELGLLSVMMMHGEMDHHIGNNVPYSFRQVCGFFNVPCWPCNTEDAEDGAYGL